MSVFIVQQPKVGDRKFTYDISPCLQYGQPVYIFDPYDQPGLTPVPSLHAAKLKLRDFSPDTDFLCWAGGDPYALVLVTGILADEFGTINFLRWERVRDENRVRTGAGYYVPVKLELRRKVQHV